MGCRTGFYVSILTQGDTLTLQDMAKISNAIIPAALTIEKLPGATRDLRSLYRTRLPRSQKRASSIGETRHSCLGKRSSPLNYA
jgi:S-ribosylhomocysteine lyase LuxS involved in autoinducer biosynthesis